MAKNYDVISNEIIDLVGGKENIALFTHCMTRLRFTIKDKSLVKIEEIEKLKDVIGTQWFGEQLQVIVGTDVANIYSAICDKTGIKPEAAVDENLDKAAVKGNYLTRIINALSKSVLPIIDIIIPAGLLMLIVTVLGPSQLNLISTESDIYRLLTFVSNTAFYFLPIFMGYSASKVFGGSPMIGAFLGAVMIHPTLIEIVNSGEAFTVYGIPMTLVNYTSQTIPMFMVAFVMSKIEKWLRKNMPGTLAPTFAPLLVIIVMIPIELCLIGPIGSWVGTAFINAITWLAAKGSVASFIVTTIIGAVWVFTVLFGFNMPVYLLALELLATNSVDTVIFPGVICSFFALMGINLGAFLKFLKLKNVNESSESLTSLITLAIGGISEPSIYGIGVRFKKPLIYMAIGGAVGAALCVIFKVWIYIPVAHSGIFGALAFFGSTTAKGLIGTGCAIVSLLVAAVLTYLYGIDETKLK